MMVRCGSIVVSDMSITGSIQFHPLLERPLSVVEGERMGKLMETILFVIVFVLLGYVIARYDYDFLALLAIVFFTIWFVKGDQE